MSNRIWMPLYWGDYHQKTQHLTTWQHGAYMLLIGAYWMTGKAIARANATAIARCLPEQKDELDAILLEFFYVGKDGLLHNKRLDEELEKAAKISKARSKAGKSGVKAKQANATSNDEANDKQLLTQSQSQSHISSSEEITPHTPQTEIALDEQYAAIKQMALSIRSEWFDEDRVLALWKKGTYRAYVGKILEVMPAFAKEKSWDKCEARFLPAFSKVMADGAWKNYEPKKEKKEREINSWI